MTKPSADRDEKGRFARGNAGGPGRAKGRGYELQRAAQDAVTPEHVAAMMRKAMRLALEGSLTAMRFVMERTVGRAPEAQVIAEPVPGDEGKVHLRVHPQNAGPAPRIHYAEDASVSEASDQLKENLYTTAALRVNFLVCDPSGQYETGDPVTWSNALVLRNRLSEEGGQRKVELFVAPRGAIRFTLDGSEPREGVAYKGPIEIGDGDVLIRVFAEADSLETKTEFPFPAKGKQGVQIDNLKPARLVASRGPHKLDSRAKTFEGLKQASDKSATFESISLTVGQGNLMIAVSVGEIAVDAAFIEDLLVKVLEKFPDTGTPVTMTFRKAHFASGHDLRDFAEKLGLELHPGDVEQ